MFLISANHFFNSLRVVAGVTLLSFASCKKDLPPTIINGVVTDKVTGASISAATVIFQFIYPGHDGGEYSKFVTLSTDIEGKFSHTQDSEYSEKYSEVRKNGFVTHPHLSFKRGMENNLEIQLIPKDGILKLNISNTSGTVDPLHIVLLNPSMDAEAKGLPAEIKVQPYPLLLGNNENHVAFYDLPSGEFTKISWGFNDFFPNVTLAQFMDSIYLVKGDTVEFSIDF